MAFSNARWSFTHYKELHHSFGFLEMLQKYLDTNYWMKQVVSDNMDSLQFVEGGAKLTTEDHIDYSLFCTFFYIYPN